MTNEELIKTVVDSMLVEKGLISSTDIATAGKLGVAQTERFLTQVVDMTQLKGSVRAVSFTNESLEINKMNIGSRVAVRASEAVAPSVRRGVSTSKITLTPQEIIVAFEISDTFKEINLEGASVEQTIVNMMSTQTANDVEELMINGNTLGPARIEADLEDGGSATGYIKDDYMSMMNGWLRLADSGNLYDALGADLSQSIFSAMITSMPLKYRRMKTDMRFFVSADHEQFWRNRLASRATGLGDQVLQSQDVIRPFGIPLVAVPLLDKQPRVVDHKTFGAAVDTQTLRFQPITSLQIHDSTLADTPTTPYVITTDYTVNMTTGAITTTVGPGAMAAGGVYKCTYLPYGQALLTNAMNLIIAIGRDIRLERQRNIHRRTNEFVLTLKVDAKIEEVLALVKGVNIGIN